MITRGLEAASKGMQALIQYEDVIANNVANVNTTGFKRTNITFKNIMDEKVEQRGMTQDQGPRNVGSLSLGSSVDRTYIDYSQGPMNSTGSKLDVAIEGEGFYKIRLQNTIDKPDDEKNHYYTRNGNFHLTQDHYLVNKFGDYVMDDADRRIRITRNPEDPNPSPTTRIDIEKELIIGEDGLMQVVGKEGLMKLQKIQIVDFQDKTKVSSIGDGKFLPIEGQNPARFTKKDGFALQQGYLEGANANTVSEMLASINVSRSYETLAKLVKTQGDTVGQAIELGKIKG